MTPMELEVVSEIKPAINWKGFENKTPFLVVSNDMPILFDDSKPTHFLKTKLITAPALTYSDCGFIKMTFWSKFVMEADAEEYIVHPDDGKEYAVVRREGIMLDAQLNSIFNLTGDDRIIPITHFYLGPNGKKVYTDTLTTIHKVKEWFADVNYKIHLCKSTRPGSRQIMAIPTLLEGNIVFPSKYKAPSNFEIIEDLN